MEVRLYKNKSEYNRVVKDISSETIFTGTARYPISVLSPIINIETTLDLSSFNYMRILDFNRYYFITKIDIVRNTLWQLTTSVDVLMTYAGDIKKSVALIDVTGAVENTSPYIMDNEKWVTKVKNKTDIISFPSGLLEEGQYILITAGGLVN